MGPSDGNDGPWSTFAFRIGEPEQVVKLLVGTTTSETWVVDESGCNNLASSCPSNRGYLFNETASTTWEENNLYDIPAESNLGIYASGQYGFDTVGLSWQGSGGPFVNKTVVAGITAPDFYLGEPDSAFVSIIEWSDPLADTWVVKESLDFHSDLSIFRRLIIHSGVI